MRKGFNPLHAMLLTAMTSIVGGIARSAQESASQHKMLKVYLELWVVERQGQWTDSDIHKLAMDVLSNPVFGSCTTDHEICKLLTKMGRAYRKRHESNSKQ